MNTFTFIKADGTLLTNNFEYAPVQFPIISGSKMLTGDVITVPSSPATIHIEDNTYKVGINSRSTNDFYVSVSGGVLSVLSDIQITGVFCSVSVDVANHDSNPASIKSIEFIPRFTGGTFNGAYVVKDSLIYTTDVNGHVTVNLVPGVVYSVLLHGNRRNTPFDIRPTGTSCNAKDVWVSDVNAMPFSPPTNSASFAYPAQVSDKRYMLSGSVVSSTTASYIDGTGGDLALNGNFSNINGSYFLSSDSTTSWLNANGGNVVVGGNTSNQLYTLDLQNGFNGTATIGNTYGNVVLNGTASYINGHGKDLTLNGALTVNNLFHESIGDVVSGNQLNAVPNDNAAYTDGDNMYVFSIYAFRNTPSGKIYSSNPLTVSAKGFYSPYYWYFQWDDLPNVDGYYVLSVNDALYGSTGLNGYETTNNYFLIGFNEIGVDGANGAVYLSTADINFANVNLQSSDLVVNNGVNITTQKDCTITGDNIILNANKYVTINDNLQIGNVVDRYNVAALNIESQRALFSTNGQLIVEFSSPVTIYDNVTINGNLSVYRHDIGANNLSCSAVTASNYYNYTSYNTVTTSSTNWITCSLNTPNQLVNLKSGLLYSFTSSNLPTTNTIATTTVFLNNTAATTSSLAFPSDWVFMGSKPTSISSSMSGILSVRNYGGTKTVAAWTNQIS